jgi:hypothetical protein
MRRLIAAVVVSMALAESSTAAVLCTKPHKGGRLDGTVKIRDACRPGEIQLAPEDVGFCCTASSTTSTSTTTSSCPTFTMTTLGMPDCGDFICGGLCANARQCVPDPQSGACGCTGTGATLWDRHRIRGVRRIVSGRPGMSALRATAAERLHRRAPLRVRADAIAAPLSWRLP